VRQGGGSPGNDRRWRLAPILVTISTPSMPEMEWPKSMNIALEIDGFCRDATARCSAFVDQKLRRWAMPQKG